MKNYDDLVTVTEAARLRGVSKARVKQWLAAGRLKRVEKYGRVLVSRREVMSLKPLAGGRPSKKKAAGTNE
jgi:hypothetical protein